MLLTSRIVLLLIVLLCTSLQQFCKSDENLKDPETAKLKKKIGNLMKNQGKGGIFSNLGGNFGNLGGNFGNLGGIFGGNSGFGGMQMIFIKLTETKFHGKPWQKSSIDRLLLNWNKAVTMSGVDGKFQHTDKNNILCIVNDTKDLTFFLDFLSHQKEIVSYDYNSKTVKGLGAVADEPIDAQDSPPQKNEGEKEGEDKTEKEKAEEKVNKKDNKKDSKKIKKNKQDNKKDSKKDSKKDDKKDSKKKNKKSKQEKKDEQYKNKDNMKSRKRKEEVEKKKKSDIIDTSEKEEFIEL